jgi:hypothetical protein
MEAQLGKKSGRVAHVVFKGKITLDSGLLKEYVMWRIPKTKAYPEGMKYRLALVDSANQKLLVLFDNHYPKGHHVHRSDGSEVPYAFDSLEKLVKDYEEAIRNEERKYANQKNKN